MNRQIDCTFFTEHLDAYLDSELDQDARQAMNRHAGNCPSCGERLESMTRLLTMCAELDEGLAVPLEAQADWRRAIREAATAQPPARRQGHAFRRWAGGVAAALMLLTGGTFAYRMNAALPRAASPQTRMAASRSGAVQTLYYPGSYAASEARAGALVLEADGEVSQAVAADEAPAADALSQPAAENMVLRTAERRIQSASFDQHMQGVQDLVAEYEGYFEQSTVNGQAASQGGQGRTADLTARIPAAQFEDFLASLDAVGTLVYKSESAENISDRYYEVEARLAGYRVQMERVNQLMSAAGGVEDMLLLEEKRSEVLQQIDSLESQVRNWSNQAQWDTVYVTLTEAQTPEQPQTLGERVKTAFSDSVRWLGGFLQDAAVVLSMAAPVLVIVVPAVVLVWIVVAAIKRRKNR